MLTSFQLLEYSGVFHAGLELFASAATLTDAAENVHALLTPNHVVVQLVPRRSAPGESALYSYESGRFRRAPSQEFA